MSLSIRDNQGEEGVQKRLQGEEGVATVWT